MIIKEVRATFLWLELLGWCVIDQSTQSHAALCPWNTKSAFPKINLSLRLSSHSSTPTQKKITLREWRNSLYLLECFCIARELNSRILTNEYQRPLWIPTLGYFPKVDLSLTLKHTHTEEDNTKKMEKLFIFAWMLLYCKENSTLGYSQMNTKDPYL